MGQLRLRLLLLLSIIYSAHSWQLPFSLPTHLLRPHATASPLSPRAQLHSLKLRHAVHMHSSDRSLPPLHRTYSANDLAALSATLGDSSTQVIRTKREVAWRPNDNQAFQAARRSSYYTSRAISQGRVLSISELKDTLEGSFLQWDAIDIETPDVSDVETLASLGKMASNAYTLPDNTAGWYDNDGRWNLVSWPFYRRLVDSFRYRDRKEGTDRSANWLHSLTPLAGWKMD